MRSRRVRCLLMGGQACVLYGGAEFSRDADLALLASPRNFDRLRQALADLDAEPIAVPPPELKYLLRGHALHFRCRAADAAGLRVDIMSVMRGADGFAALWRRRTTLELPGSVRVDVLSLPDLVRVKKTQRDKDWPMVRRLLEFDYLANRRRPDRARVGFWLMELRTPSLLRELVSRFPSAVRRLAPRRPLLACVATESDDRLAGRLRDEEERERSRDAEYWKPLRLELERLRHARGHRMLRP